ATREDAQHIEWRCRFGLVRVALHLRANTQPATTPRCPRVCRSGGVAWISGPILAVVFAAWITWPAWGAEPFAGVDVVGHILRVAFGLGHIFRRGGVSTAGHPHPFLVTSTICSGGPAEPTRSGRPRRNPRTASHRAHPEPRGHRLLRHLSAHGRLRSLVTWALQASRRTRGRSGT